MFGSGGFGSTDKEYSKPINMTALKLVNNTGLRSEKNLCYVNTELQLLYSIPEVNKFFTSKKYRKNYGEKLPLCDEISRIFVAGGRVQTSAAELRRLVGSLNGRKDMCDGVHCTARHSRVSHIAA